MNTADLDTERSKTHHNVPEPLIPLLVPIEEIAHYPGNARTHDEALLRDSLERNGQYRPVVINRGTLTGRPNEVLAGNGTTGAARDLGWTHVAATFVDVDDEQARRIVLIDNRANDVAGYDLDALADLLKAAQPDLSGTGYDQNFFDGLIASLYRPDQLTDPDDAPSLPDTPRSVLGDVWLLGPHRLVCGDSTTTSAMHLAMNGELADCTWTDPPYGVEYTGKTKDALTIRNDGADGLPTILTGAFAGITEALKPGSAVYVAHPDTGRMLFETKMAEAGWSVRQNLIWVKDQMVLGRSDYHYRHEPILFGYTGGGKGRLGRGSTSWHGDNAQTTIVEVPKPQRSSEHPTMKPTALIVRHINNSCRPGGLLYEPFGGSGSTLIAAHLTGRRANLIELDPKYVDVICRRWQEHTGILPINEATAAPVDFTEE